MIIINLQYFILIILGNLVFNYYYYFWHDTLKITNLHNYIIYYTYKNTFIIL